MSDTILPLTIQNLSFRAGGQVLLNDINLEFKAGPLSVIMGHNGAGKSLLLRLIHGLIAPSSGTISWNGMTQSQAHHAQAMVFQKPIMLRRSVLANIEYPLKLKHIERDARRALALDALEMTGLSDIAERHAPLLSGGEQQKLAIARAIALKPQILFLDEPTASLDPKSTGEVERLITTIHAQGTKVIMTSHLVAQVKRLADQIVFLHEGEVAEIGTANQIFAKPKSAQVRAYLAGELPD